MVAAILWVKRIWTSFSVLLFSFHLIYTSILLCHALFTLPYSCQLFTFLCSGSIWSIAWKHERVWPHSSWSYPNDVLSKGACLGRPFRWYLRYVVDDDVWDQTIAKLFTHTQREYRVCKWAALPLFDGIMISYLCQFVFWCCQHAYARDQRLYIQFSGSFELYRLNSDVGKIKSISTAEKSILISSVYVDHISKCQG